MFKRVVKLSTIKGQLVYLLGTAHVSKRSESDVRDLIHNVKPRLVFLELCELRKGMIEIENTEPEPPVTLSETINMLRSGQVNPFTVLYMGLMKYYDLKPGGEMKVAAETAKEMGDIPIVLGDRFMDLTTSRLWNGLTFWDKVKLFKSQLIPSFSTSTNTTAPTSIEAQANELLDHADSLIEEIKYIEKHCPWVVECLLNERDKFMVLELEKSMESICEKECAVAVVGAAHVAGMTKFWNARQELFRSGAGIPIEESERLHYSLQLCPGLELPDGSGEYTKEMLREYVARAIKQRGNEG